MKFIKLGDCFVNIGTIARITNECVYLNIPQSSYQYWHNFRNAESCLTEILKIENSPDPYAYARELLEEDARHNRATIIELVSRLAAARVCIDMQAKDLKQARDINALLEAELAAVKITTPPPSPPKEKRFSFFNKDKP